jgi:hypothetical protein
MRQYLIGFCFVSVIFLFVGCAKQTAEISLPLPSSYYPLETGHAFIYRLDSTLIAYNGISLTVHSYLAKDSIADTIRDNQNRLSYRVYRLITDTLGIYPWQNIATYYITPTDHSVEVMDENNLRFIKLKEPIQNGFSWQGNSYIDTKSAGSLYQYLDGWSFTYQNVGQPFTVLNGVLNNTITVLQQDETSPPGDFDPNNYQQRNYSVEVYAQDIGLVYKEFLHWTWQPIPGEYENDSYGIKLNLIEYH